MTEEQLKEIENHYKEHFPFLPRTYDIPSLIAEVRRLRGALERIAIEDDLDMARCAEDALGWRTPGPQPPLKGK